MAGLKKVSNQAADSHRAHIQIASGSEGVSAVGLVGDAETNEDGRVNMTIKLDRRRRSLGSAYIRSLSGNLCQQGHV